MPTAKPPPCDYRTTISYVAKAGPKAGKLVRFRMKCKLDKGHAFWHVLGSTKKAKVPA